MDLLRFVCKSKLSNNLRCFYKKNQMLKICLFNFRFALEDLFYKYGVDLEVWAHEHSYERFWPLYNYKVYNGSYDKPYTNPKAPVHIVVGSAVCIEYY